MRDTELRARLEALYDRYDHRFVDPDPLQLVRAQVADADREVVAFLAAALAYGGVGQIKTSIAKVLAYLGPGPASKVRGLDPGRAARALRGFRHRFNDGVDVACLLFMLRQMIEAEGSIEAFFALGLPHDTLDIGPALTSFCARALDLDHGRLYGRGPLPRSAGVRFFFASPADGSACKRLNLFLRWMVRKDSVDLGLWQSVRPSALVIPLDAHILAISRRIRLTRRRSPGWAMAVDVTRRLRRLDPHDPVKYDFALHRMGLFGKRDEIDSLR